MRGKRSGLPLAEAGSSSGPVKKRKNPASNGLAALLLLEDYSTPHPPFNGSHLRNTVHKMPQQEESLSPPPLTTQPAGNDQAGSSGGAGHRARINLGGHTTVAGALHTEGSSTRA
jgi:hypothetical protein